MRIGALWHYTSAANYRVVAPLTVLAHRGHDVVMPPDSGSLPDKALVSCDAVIIYRRFDEPTCATIRRLKKAGVAVIWDNDDDFLHVAQSRRLRRETGGRNSRRIFEEALRAARMADIVTTTTETLAGVMRNAGVRDVRTIENYLMRDPTFAVRSKGMTVGWIAGLEHHADAVALGLPETLTRLQERHPNLEVTCIGVDLGLRERYRHASFVPFNKLDEVMASFSIGIAPITDTKFNRARSNIKVKEYAASSIPWLASRVTPYEGLDERHGGRLVGDDEWFDALDDLIQDAEARKQLSANGATWARQQTIGEKIGDYESLFADAVEKATGRRPATVVRSTVADAPAAQTQFTDARRFTVKIPQRMMGR